MWEPPGGADVPCGDFHSDNSVDVMSVNSATEDSLYFYMSDDSMLFEQPEQTSPRWLAKEAVCTNVLDSMSCVASMETSQTFQFPTPLLIEIPLHSTPISTPVKPLFHTETSVDGDDNITMIDQDSLHSTNSLVVLNSEVNSFSCSESSGSFLFLQEPTPELSISPVRSSSGSKKKVVEVAQPDCCHQCCLLHLTSSEISSTLEYFNSKNVVEQNRFLVDSFRATSNKEIIHHMICGKHVCKDAYIKILQISEKRYNYTLKLLNTNPTVKIDRKSFLRSESTKVAEAKAWLRRYFSRIGDSMPHIDQVHLPHGLTKRDVYYNMKSQLQEQGLNSIISLSHFYSIWSSSFEKVTIPKV